MRNTILISILGFTLASYAEVLSEIDHIDSRLEYAGTTDLKLGDRLRIGNFSLGGFMEVRNEERFHEEYLPNHNWRGVVRFAHEQVFVKGGWGSLTIPLAFQHESAHASMGIEGPTRSAFEMIYDGNYRNVNRNGFSTGAVYQFQGPVYLILQGFYTRYLFSRNAPEAADTHLTEGNAMQFGAELRLPMGSRKLAACASAYYRQEFESDETKISTIYYDSDTGPVALKVNYSPLQRTRTISALLGLRYSWNVRPVMLYSTWTFGNQGGFVDSRAETYRVAMGIQLGS